MAQHVNVAQWSLYLKDLIPKIRETNVVVEIDFLLAECEKLSPSLVGKSLFSYILL